MLLLQKQRNAEFYHTKKSFNLIVISFLILQFLLILFLYKSEWLLIQVSVMNVTDIMLYQWLSITEYLHKSSKSMHIKVMVIETTSC